MISLRNQKGIGLLELLIVIAIIGIMSLIVVPSYVNYKKEKAMSFARTQISNNIRMVHSYTLSAVKLPGGTFPPYGGYGIHFMESSGSQTGKEYMLFADKMANGFYDSGDVDIERISLPSGITITDLQYKKSGVWYNTLGASSYIVADYVSFPPYGNTHIDGSGTIVTGLQITISNGIRSENIILNNSGSVN